MYPGTKVNWYDESAITSTNVETVDNKPLFLLASSFDKGPEEMKRVSGDSFYSLYGTDISFAKHGQAAITAAAIIDNGGELLLKRVVADDATLANVVLVATVTSETTTSTTTETDDDGNETEVSVDSTSVTISWSAVTIENCYSFDEVKEQALALLDEENGVYPLIIVADNGRGTSSKAIRIAANNEVSVTIGKVFYNISVYEGTTRLEQVQATLNSCLYNDQNWGVEEWTMDQVKLHVEASVYNALITSIAESLGTDAATVDTYDLVTGLTVKQLTVDNLSVDADSLDLTADYGIELSGGDNGEFGNYPVDTDPWIEALIEFYDGSFTDEIYDLDEHKIAFVPDCNFPYDVKEAIAQLVTFREDCMFFRDMRTDVTNYATTVETLANYETSNKFITNYLTYYKVLDPLTKKRITVTMIYDLCKCLCAVYDTGIHVPTAGIANGFILESAIEGTVNFVPRITPDVNQKQLLDDLRVNYAIFMSGQCIVQSLYTSQEAYTQLSYANNVLAIQDVVRSVRTSCPKKRYTFIEDHDFSEYAEHVNNVLKGFTTNFDTLKFEYTKDTLLAQQKIFYASIRFAFKDWAQSEIFDVYAISNTEAESDIED